MKLFLASEADNPKTVKVFEKFVGGWRGKTIAYIPTALNGELPFESWKTESGTWQLVQTFESKVTAVQLENYKNSSVIKELEGKDVLWFGGGSPGYLMYWIRRCGIDKALPELLKKSIYFGSSAGAMIAGRSLEVTEWYPGDSEPGASAIPALHLVDFDIYPHYEESMLNTIKKQYHGNKLYLLKNGEEIIVEDGKITVVDEERIIIPKR